MDAVAELVQAEEVGAAGLGTGAGDDGYDFALVDVAVLLEQGFSEFDHGFGGLHLGAMDGDYSPEEVEAVDGDVDGAEGVDGRCRLVLGKLDGGRAGFGEDGDP